MDRKTVIAGLRAYKYIDGNIKSKLLFAQESGEEEKYEREAAELRSVKRKILAGLNELPQLERDCVWRHYIHGERWVRISRKYAYSEKQIRNISGRGLDRLGKAFDQCGEVARFCRAEEQEDTS